jgi:hypothetical protein
VTTFARALEEIDRTPTSQLGVAQPEFGAALGRLTDKMAARG